MAGSLNGVEFVERGTNRDMTLYQGSSVEFALPFTDTNITISDGSLEIRDTPSAVTPIASFTQANSRVSVVNNIITFTMTATDSAALAAGDYTYDVEVIHTSGKTLRVMQGSCVISPEVTRT